MISQTESITALESSSDYDEQRKYSVAKDVLATTASHREEVAIRWDEIRDYKLLEWVTNPQWFEEEGLVHPSRNATQEAISLLDYMRSNDWPLPTGVVADGDGGIVFENRQGSLYQRLEIDAAGATTLITFIDNKIVDQRSIGIPH